MTHHSSIRAKQVTGKVASVVTGCLALSLVAPFAKAETREIKIPKSIIVAAANAYLSGFRVNIDNWGKFQNGDTGWYAENSYMLFPSGTKVKLQVPRTDTYSNKIRKFNAYVNNLGTSHINVNMEGSRLRLNHFFESAGDEIKLGCISKIGLTKNKPCALKILKHTGQINNAHVYAWFKPTFSGSKIRLSPSDLQIDFDFKPDAKLLKYVANAPSIKKIIKAKVRDHAKSKFISEFNNPKVQNDLTADINSELFGKAVDLVEGRLGSSAGKFIKDNLKISSIKSKGTNYVIAVKYPDIVTSNSVKITGFSPKKVGQTKACPFNYGFTANVQTSTKVKGKVFIETKSGKTSQKLNWQMPKAGVSKSSIDMKISGSPGKQTQTSARLVVNWRGSLGNLHTVKSSWKPLKASCSKSAGNSLKSL